MTRTPTGGGPPVVRTPRPIPTPAPVSAPAASLDGLLDGVLPDPDGDYGVVVEDLGSGARAAVNESQLFPSASLYKLGLAWMVLRQVDSGRMSLDAPLEIEDGDTVEVEPDGGVAAGDAPTLREALHSMLSVSSNAAAHALLRMLGRTAFNQEMLRIGLRQTHVDEDVVDADSAESEGLAVTSAADVAHLLRLLATSAQLSAASRDLLVQCLASSASLDALRDTLPEDIEVIDKTGNLTDVSNVGAILRSEHTTVILVVLDAGVDPGDARGVIAQTGQAALQLLLTP
jgi:beta-lactamase class A